MSALPFRVFQRTGRSGKKTWSARYLNSEGITFRTVSFPDAKTRPQAERLARAQMDQGILPSKDNHRLSEYLMDFWSLESDYARGKALRGRPLSAHYVEDCRSAAKVHVVPTLGDKRLEDLTPIMLETLVLELNDEGVGARRINTALNVVKIAVGDFYRKHRQPDPLATVQRIAERPKARGILTVDELAKVAALEGQSPRIICAVLLAALCGLRAGEVRGLQFADVDTSDPAAPWIHVKNNFITAKEGLKLPKSHKPRDVPAPRIVLDAIEACRKVNRKGSPFVVFNDDRNDRPMEKVSIHRGFIRTMDRIGVKEADRTARVLTFHGLRNFYVSHCRAVGVPDYVVQRFVGHATMAMTEGYTRVNVTDFADALARLDGPRPAIAEKTAMGGAL